jgi:hypothetical protein
VITSKDLLYEATPAERTQLVQAIMDLRNEWYDIPKLVSDALEKEKKAEEAEKADDEPVKN